MKSSSRETEIFQAKKARSNASKTKSSFTVSPIEAFRGELPFYRQPTEVGCFSLDDKRSFHDDNRQLRLFSPPHNINFDLRAGYKDFVKRDDGEKEGLEHLLQWTNRHKEKFEIIHSPTSERFAREKPPLPSLHTDFITWRGHLTKIMCTPYEKRDSWQMAATLYNGTIYISEVETEENRHKRENMEEKHKEMCYWGYNFESFVTSPLDKNSKLQNGKGKAGKYANNDSEAFITVIRTRLDKHSLVFGAEVDCCAEKNGAAPANYIELKTSIQPHHHNQHFSFKRYKLIKWWAQSYLAGVPKIICGFRDHHGNVKELQTYNTLAIPRLVRDEEGLWDSSICLNFLDRFLTWMKEVVTKSGPDVVYMFSWKEPFLEVTVSEVLDGSDRFLPDWYLESGGNSASPFSFA
ncbi:decapping and exoribonuclease protein-like [Montipora foliosa]|uniref:decapping and exoribonuclease protein-like n=1 Tax=Montipora foliosa TaxID=591990 RepID=UPI0035F145CE